MGRLDFVKDDLVQLSKSSTNFSFLNGPKKKKYVEQMSSVSILRRRNVVVMSVTMRRTLILQNQKDTGSSLGLLSFYS